MSGQGACRVGDTGEGICHLHVPPLAYITTFYEGSEVFSNDGVGIVLIGHKGHASCGHDTIAITGSALMTVGEAGVGVHRVGDTGHIIGSPASTYTAITGSGVLSNE